MPDTTTKVLAPRALGGESATRQSILQSVNVLDEQMQQEQFFIRQGWNRNGATINDVVWDAGGTRFAISVGPGKMRFASGLEVWAGGTVYLNAPAAGTSYYMSFREDGTFVFPTSESAVAGQAVIYRIDAPNPLATPSAGQVVDRRGLLAATDFMVAGAGDLTGTWPTITIATSAISVAKLADEVAILPSYLGL